VPAWGSVTVVHADALAADALSTALHVMGPTEGLAWGEASGVAALFLQSSDGTLRASWTSHLAPWLIHDSHQ
jgi:thiamine biosynthesis lipoprotein